ncbi:hypothetical protein H0G86_010024 [Trichoderma simmonsii]|uniref:Uncharacterized protein n=1 Tax=Trichoderma simmonsii TaxID=1491479 RepID=A0A8G0PHS8_9HYPO|nr:hypothetical protein H0G86_010024 [Trichoderma simmonsii]
MQPPSVSHMDARRKRTGAERYKAASPHPPHAFQLLLLTILPCVVNTMKPRASSGMNKFTSALRKSLQSNRHSVKSSQDDWRNSEPQRISGENMVPKLLAAELKKKWKNEYRVEMRSNEYRIRAPGHLSDEEIRRCSALCY